MLQANEVLQLRQAEPLTGVRPARNGEAAEAELSCPPRERRDCRAPLRLRHHDAQLINLHPAVLAVTLSDLRELLHRLCGEERREAEQVGHALRKGCFDVEALRRRRRWRRIRRRPRRSSALTLGVLAVVAKNRLAQQRVDRAPRRSSALTLGVLAVVAKNRLAQQRVDRAPRRSSALTLSVAVVAKYRLAQQRVDRAPRRRDGAVIRRNELQQIIHPALTARVVTVSRIEERRHKSSVCRGDGPPVVRLARFVGKRKSF